MSEPPLGFGQQLRRYRERASLSRDELAERTQLTTSGIAALERGRRQRPYPDTVRRLAEGLELSPDEHAALAALASPPGVRTTVRPPLETLQQAPASNLPAPRANLIGREQAVAALVKLVPAHTGRLVTLTGIGGGGKTRLALAVAAALRGAFADDVWLVELAPIAAPALVPLAVAEVLAIPERAGVPLVEQLVEALGNRRLLLVLDNCEHLIDACAALSKAVLDGCPNVHILATSREPLQLAGERCWRVPPLALPDPGRPASLAELAQYPAVQLFVERAGAVDAAFSLTAQNVDAVTGVCARLDGIPLAIELAAAHVRVLAVAQILERLDDSLRLLTGTNRAAPTRHQTLRATLKWSHDLLSPPEQLLFQRLAVFADGCDIEAVEAVCTGPELPAEAVLELLSHLVDKSLVQAAEGDRVARYRLLEPVRQYAAAVASDEEREAVRARHAAWFLALAEEAAPELHGPAQVAWLERLERERDNLRAALHWTDAHEEVATEARLAVALVPFWERHSHLSEGRRWLETVLALPPTSLAPSPRTRVLIGVGRLAQLQADLVAAAAYLEESLAAARAAGDRRGIAESLAWLGVVQMRRRASATAVELFEESLTLYQEEVDVSGVALVLLNLGVTVGYQGDLSRARRLLEESLTRYRQLGDVRFVAITLTMLGSTVRSLGEPERAAALLRDGLAGHRIVGDRVFMTESLRQLARLEAEPRPLRAARLLGAAEALRDTLGTALAPTNRATDEETIAAIRARLPDTEFAAAWAAGRALTLEQAAAEAIVEGKRHASLASAVAPQPNAVLESLTPRERAVTRLLAQGYTDREIATTLAISVRTAGVHVQRAIAKLGVRSRWQVGDWARDQGFADLEAG